MSNDALDAYKSTQDEQLGSNGVFTEHAVYDPDFQAVDLYGIFDENTFRGDKGAGNVEQKKDGPRFVISEIVSAMESINVYKDKEIYITRSEKRFKIQFIDKDEQGAQVLWLV